MHGLPPGPKISDLLPALFEVDPPEVDPRDPLVYTGSLLRAYEVQLLPSVERRVPGKPGYTICEAFGGYSVLKKIATTKRADYYKELWKASGSFPSWIGTCRFSDLFERVLRLYGQTRFGDVVVKRDGERTILSLNHLMGLMREGRVSTEMTPEEVGSAVVTVPKQEPITNAVIMMLANHIRRLFVEGKRGQFVSDRSVIDFLFSPQRLELAKTEPEKWLEGGVGELKQRQAKQADWESIYDIAETLGDAPDDCVLTDGGKVVTRWDAVMKPWDAGKLTFQ